VPPVALRPPLVNVCTSRSMMEPICVLELVYSRCSRSHALHRSSFVAAA